LGPNCSSRRRASSPVRPLDESSVAAPVNFAGGSLAEGNGMVAAMIVPTVTSFLIFAQNLTEKRLTLRPKRRYATAVEIVENLHLET
jgi:hypothetical protein